MNNISQQDETSISKQFAAFCCRVLKNEAYNIYAEYSRRKKREKSLNELSISELLNMSMCDCYFKEVFNICGMQITISDYNLTEAINKLLPIERKIVLLSYFVGMTDKQIAETLNLTNWTAFRYRTSSLKKLKKSMIEGD